MNSPVTDPPRLRNRAKLEAATRALHDRTEALWAGTGGFSTRTKYLAFLATLLDAHHRLGLPAAEARKAEGDIADEQIRLEALYADTGRVPLAPVTVRPSPSYAWGIGYVLNGSALGAVMMLKEGHVPEGWPTAYLEEGCAYAKSGKLAAFFRALDAAELDMDEAALGARDTFAVFLEAAPG